MDAALMSGRKNYMNEATMSYGRAGGGSERGISGHGNTAATQEHQGPRPAHASSVPRSTTGDGIELNVARGFLSDAVSGRDRIPYLHECPLGRVGLLAGAERGVVGA